MTDYLCPTCGPITEDDGLLTGPGDAVCCAFCGCPEEDMTPLWEAYEALVRERDKAHADIAEMVKKAADKHLAGYRELGSRAAEAETSRDNAVQQAKMWAQEARTQRATVMEIGKLVGCENDWEMVGAVRNTLAAMDALEFYADKSRYSSSWEARHNHHVMEDKGEVARVALARIAAAPAPAEPEGVRLTRQTAQELLEASNDYCDEGPAGYGWKSDRLSKAVAELEAQLAKASDSTIDDQQAALFRAHNGAED